MSKKAAVPVSEQVLKLGSIVVRCRFSQLVGISKIKPNPDNPNHHPPEQLAVLEKLIRAQGIRRPLVVSRQSGMLVKGHGLYEVAKKKLKLKKVPVEYQDYESLEQEMADMVADNAVAQMSDMSQSELVAMLRDVQKDAPEFDLSLFALPETLLTLVNETEIPSLPLEKSKKTRVKEEEPQTDANHFLFKVLLTNAQYTGLVRILNKERREFKLRSIAAALVHVVERLKKPAAKPQKLK